jgi:hypothetical protein
MRRAILDPTVLDGNFSDDESGRRLRSSCRKGRSDEPDEPPTMEVVEEPGPSSSTSRETGTEAAGDLPASVPEPAEAKRPTISNANVFEKVEINFIKANTEKGADIMCYQITMLTCTEAI